MDLTTLPLWGWIVGIVVAMLATHSTVAVVAGAGGWLLKALLAKPPVALPLPIVPPALPAAPAAPSTGHPFIDMMAGEADKIMRGLAANMASNLMGVAKPTPPADPTSPGK